MKTVVKMMRMPDGSMRPVVLKAPPIKFPLFCGDCGIAIYEPKDAWSLDLSPDAAHVVSLFPLCKPCLEKNAKKVEERYAAKSVVLE